MMKYLVYARRNGEQGEECHSCYKDYEIIECDSISETIFKWWEITTSKAKEVWDFHKDEWEIKEQPCNYYYIKDKTGWMIYNIVIIPLRPYSNDDVQPLDKLNVNK